MQKRVFGKHGFEIPILGYGIMRMPTTGPGSRDIDEGQALEMIRYAIDNGVTYIDTAYNYHGGMSELFVARALKDGYREKVTLATKMPHWLVNAPEDLDRLLNEQLSRLEAQYIDCYLLHGINKTSWKKLQDNGVLDFLDKAKADGRIRFAGFSFHDPIVIFKDILDSYHWDFCMIQLNYMDEYNQAGIDGLRYAAGKGLPVIIMEPLLGGRLAHGQPAEVERIWAESGFKRSPAEWGLRWVWNLPEITSVLSGMSTMEQISENIRIAKEALPSSLSIYELEVIEQVKQVYRKRTKVNCTKCMYCMPCPYQVQIPMIFEWYNEHSMFDVPQQEISGYYGHMIERKGDASMCTSCGKCESVCPQGINICDTLREFHSAFSPPAIDEHKPC